MTVIKRRTKDASCILLYVGQGVYGICLSAVSPTLVEAQKSWPMTYEETALYPSLLAVSMILSGLIYGRCSMRWGRRITLAAAAGLSAVSTLCAAIAPGPAELLAATVSMELFSTAMQTGVMSALTERGTEGRVRRLTLGTVCASLGSLVGPWLITQTSETVTGWRGTWYLITVGFAVLAFVLPGAAGRPAVAVGSVGHNAVLDRRYWLPAAGVAAAVAGEICLVYFAPQAVARDGFGHGGLVIMPYYLGELTGRMVSAWSASRGHTEKALLGMSLLFALSGFGTFWLAGELSVRFAGMLIAGIGIGNFFPLGASIVTASVARAADRAMSRLYFLIGGFTLVAPLVFGALADKVGLQVAMVLIPLLCLGIVVTGLRADAAT